MDKLESLKLALVQLDLAQQCLDRAADLMTTAAPPINLIALYSTLAWLRDARRELVRAMNRADSPTRR